MNLSIYKAWPALLIGLSACAATTPPEGQQPQAPVAAEQQAPAPANAEQPANTAEAAPVVDPELLQFPEDAPRLADRTKTYLDLISLPLPKGKLMASVYTFRDQTGQYKPAPASTFSTALGQGATAMLTEALQDSGWFVTLEREGLQNLLTERKIVRASQQNGNGIVNHQKDLPPLMASNLLIEGGIVSYDSNIQTGGYGAKYLGVGLSEEYRVDQVTVTLRTISVNSGQILNSVSTSKTIYSKKTQFGLFRFIDFRDLLELEAGTSSNEPTQIAVRAAIESAVIHLVIDGIERNLWQLRNPDDIYQPVMQKYQKDQPKVLGQ